MGARKGQRALTDDKAKCQVESESGAARRPLIPARNGRFCPGFVLAAWLFQATKGRTVGHFSSLKSIFCSLGDPPAASRLLASLLGTSLWPAASPCCQSRSWECGALGETLGLRLMETGLASGCCHPPERSVSQQRVFPLFFSDFFTPTALAGRCSSHTVSYWFRFCSAQSN